MAKKLSIFALLTFICVTVRFSLNVMFSNFFIPYITKEEEGCVAPVIIVAVNANIVNELALHPIPIIALRQLCFEPLTSFWHQFDQNGFRFQLESYTK